MRIKLQVYVSDLLIFYIQLGRNALGGLSFCGMIEVALSIGVTKQYMTMPDQRYSNYYIKLQQYGETRPRQLTNLFTNVNDFDQEHVFLRL